MFDIQPVDVTVPVFAEPQMEVMSIIQEYTFGLALREVSMFRVWRLWRNNDYLKIYSDSPDARVDEPMFVTFNDFTRFLSRNLDVSRSKVYSRLKCYTLLEHLRYNDAQMLAMMADRPGLYEKALNAIFEYDPESRIPTAMKTDVFGVDPFDDDTIEAVRDFLADLGGAESVSDALSILMHDVLGKPDVRVRFTSGALVVYYSSTIVDEETGTEIVESSGRVEFVPSSSETPDWVLSELSRKFPSA